MAIGPLQIALILGFGVLLFHLPVRGSLPHPYAAAGAFVVASLTLGLLISTAQRASSFFVVTLTLASLRFRKRLD